MMCRIVKMKSNFINIRIFLMLAIMILQPITTVSQDDGPYIWRYWSDKDGFKEEYCSSLTLDHNGKVWINHGNTKTVSVFDGFTIQSIQNDDLLIGNVFNTPQEVQWAFAIDQNYKDVTQLRIGLQRFMNGVSKRFIIPAIQNNSKTFHETGKFLDPDKNQYFHLNVWKFIPIDSNYVLVVLPNLLYLFDAETQIMKPILSSEVSQLGEFHEIIQGKNHSAWIGAEHGAAKLKWDQTSQDIKIQWETFPFSSEDQLVSVRHIIVKDEHSICATALSTQNKNMVPIILNENIWHTIPVTENQTSISDVWSVNDKIFMMNYNSKRSLFESISMVSNGNQYKYSLHNNLRTIRNFKPVFERDGNVWLNLYIFGIARGALKLWRKDHNIRFGGESVLTITKIPNRGVAAILEKRMVIKLDEEYFEYELPLQDFSPGSVLALNDDDILFVSTDSELIRFRISQNEYVRLPVPNNRQAVTLREYKPNHVFIRLQHKDDPSIQETVVFNGSTFQPYLDHSDMKSLGGVNRLQVTQSGEVWVYGLLGLRNYSAQKVYNEKVSTSFPGKNARYMAELDNGNIWIGGSDGIFQFDGTKWESIRSDLSVLSLRKANDGSIWVITLNKVYRYKNNSWIDFNDEEGLNGNLNFRALMVDDNGIIWLATYKEIYQYDPNADRDAPRTIFDETQNSKEISPYGSTRIQFDGVDKWKYTPKDRLLFSHKIDNGGWSPFHEDNSVYLQNLTYGSHTFYVRVMDRNWNIDSTPEQFQMDVMYPWYLQSGFIICFVVLTSIIIFRYINLEYLVRLSTAVMKQEMSKRQEVEGMVREVSEREQCRIGQDLHDGLSQLLAGTLLLTRQLQDDLKTNKADPASYANDIEHFLEQSVTFTRDLVRGLTPTALNEQGLDDALQEFVINIQKLYKIKCDCHINCSINLKDTNCKTNIYRIVQEAVSNAVKHGEADHVVISVNNNKDLYIFHIHDNGKGFDTSIESHSGMGLKIMQYRSSLFKGSVHIKSDVNHGTDVICTIQKERPTLLKEE